MHKVYALLYAASELRLQAFKASCLQLIESAQWKVLLQSTPALAQFSRLLTMQSETTDQLPHKTLGASMLTAIAPHS